MRTTLLTWGFALLAAAALSPAAAQCPLTTPVQGAPVGAPLPVFPADNWWNLDISTAPVAANSGAFITWIGATRGLHPDFGGEEEPGSESIYGFPYIIVDGSQPKLPVTFEVWDESDGVDMDTEEGIPFYPIPTQAINQPHWIEGGQPGTDDLRGDSDRHILIVDCTNRHLYELYNMWYDDTENQWYGYSGAFFDLDTNDRRPDTWTSADASGMAIFPGLVRYDEASNAALTDLGHALRMTTRDTNGYVFPASHDAGNGTGAPPLGARLRLKALVNGLDPALRTADPMARRIFRTMQKYGLIIADNGSDMYISGTFDTRWDNGILNPAFNTLKASDFEVIQLGWNPPPVVPAALSSVSANPNPIIGGNGSTGTVTLTASAPAGGANVTLESSSAAYSHPPSVLVPAGDTSANFSISTVPVGASSSATLVASWDGTDKQTLVTVNPSPNLPTLTLGDAAIAESDSGQRELWFTLRLSAASQGGVSFHLQTANGTATAGSDFDAKSLDGTIAAGQTTYLVSILLNGDTTVEANETFTVLLSSVVGATLGDGSGLGSILNDDGPTLAIDDVTVTEGNAGTKLATFTVTMSQVAPGAVTFTAATVNGTATAGSDFVARSVAGNSIAAGQTTKTFAITINGDTTVEPNETFDVLLSAPVGATIFDPRGTGRIVNDDGPTVSIADVAAAEGHVGTKTATFTVKLSQAHASAVTYDIRTFAGTAGGTDFVGQLLTGQSIPAGQTTKTFVVTLKSDTTVEPNEQFTVAVSNLSGASATDDTAVGTILNDDGPTLSISDLRFAEGNSGMALATFSLALSQAATGPVTYDIATASGSAIGGTDYVQRTLLAQVFPAGQVARTFAVNIKGDTALEANEAFTVNLSNVGGATVFDAQAIGTVLNDDGPTLSVDDVAVTEGNAGTKLLTFTVSLSQAAGSDVTYTIATANGNAVAGSDYVARNVAGETIAAGLTSRTFAITINGDTGVEASEIFYVNLTQVVGATVFDAQGKGTITNDD